ncbi:ABC transporter substrate-binding protein [Aeromonas veronii]|uniref:substrate-binding periplasmic protein n=1 Tax=Aeromonas veronii TaxID=654 RepID=UPI001FD4721F|nr:ABC transporter substrate-binding protein [Aeromonas veronii]UOR18395.1 ABC transporter substrate-binding protein [Aeromonas veronii]
MPLLRQLFLPVLLLFSCMLVVAAPQPQDESISNEISAQKELLVGVPRGGYLPFIYQLPNLRYAGPLKELASRIAAEMGVSLRYIPYNSYVDAQIALQGGQIDALIGVERLTIPSYERGVARLLRYDRHP